MAPLKIITAAEPLPERPSVILIYGDPGVSKTSLFFTAEKPLLFDFDKGVERSIGRKDIVRPTKWDEIEEMMNTDSLANSGYKTVGIDTAAAALDNFVSDYLIRKDPKNSRGGGALSLSGFGAMMATWKRFVNYLRQHGMDLVILAHAQEKDMAGDVRLLRPQVTGGSYAILMAMADMVGYMEKKGVTTVINFSPTERNVGKNCAEIEELKPPHYSDPAWKTYMAEIIQRIRVSLTKQTEEQQAAEKMMNDLAEQVNKLENEEQLQEMITYIEGLEEPFRTQGIHLLMPRHELFISSQLQQMEQPEHFDAAIEQYNKFKEPYRSSARKQIAARVKELQIIFNPGIKKFEHAQTHFQNKVEEAQQEPDTSKELIIAAEKLLASSSEQKIEKALSDLPPSIAK